METHEANETKEIKETKKATGGGQAKEGNAKSTLVPTDETGSSAESGPITATNVLEKEVLQELKETKAVSKKRPAPEGEIKPVTKREKTSKQEKMSKQEKPAKQKKSSQQEKPGKQEEPGKQVKPLKQEKPLKQRQKATVVAVRGPSETLPVAPLFVLEKPKHVAAPEFQHIEISHPLPVIHNRL